MATKGNSNFSILVDTQLDTSNIEKQLKQVENSTKPITFKTDDSGIKETTNSAKELGLTFQEANLIMSRSIDIISSMVSQVYNLDSALTEFRKVSDLSGESLDEYVSHLTDLGETVARTGKPKRLSRSVRMVN